MGDMNRHCAHGTKKKKGKKVDERKKGITEKENGDSLRRKRL